MLCVGCHKNKLRKEFPPGNVCDKNHAQLYCIRCIMATVERANHCPVCKTYVTQKDPQYIACIQKLKWLFPPLEVNEGAAAKAPELDSAYGFLSRAIVNVEVVMFNGQKASLKVSHSSSIMDFKTRISEVLGVLPNKQRLIYNDKPLKTYKSNSLMKVCDYNITDNSTITLIKVLQTIADSLKEVTFNFSWQYVGLRRDYLNASAVLYSGSRRVDYVDFKNTYGAHGYLLSVRQGFGSVTHSGHGFRGNWHGTRGRHILKVNLQSLPDEVDKIFFTLSALNADSIHDFRNLTLEFYDARNSSEQLCNDKISRDVTSKAVVFCCLCRIDGCWQVFSLQESSSGNVRDYLPLFYTIERLILKGFS